VPDDAVVKRTEGSTGRGDSDEMLRADAEVAFHEEGIYRGVANPSMTW